jgi:hypothetical protein
MLKMKTAPEMFLKKQGIRLAYRPIPVISLKTGSLTKMPRTSRKQAS